MRPGTKMMRPTTENDSGPWAIVGYLRTGGALVIEAHRTKKKAARVAKTFRRYLAGYSLIRVEYVKPNYDPRHGEHKRKGTG